MAPAVGFEPTTPVQDQRVKNDGTHIGTHELWNELNEVAKKWPKLPKEIRNAILAIVRSQVITIPEQGTMDLILRLLPSKVSPLLFHFLESSSSSPCLYFTSSCQSSIPHPLRRSCISLRFLLPVIMPYVNTPSSSPSFKLNSAPSDYFHTIEFLTHPIYRPCKLLPSFSGRVAIIQLRFQNMVY